MKTAKHRVTLTGAVLAISAMLIAGTAGAGDVMTRSTEALQRDLGRGWNAQPASEYGGQIRTRSAEAAHADMVRDWNAKTSGEGPAVKRRSEAAMYKDLVRDWSPDKPVTSGQAHASGPQ